MGAAAGEGREGRAGRVTDRLILARVNAVQLTPDRPWKEGSGCDYRDPRPPALGGRGRPGRFGGGGAGKSGTDAPWAPPPARPGRVGRPAGRATFPLLRQATRRGRAF